MVSDEGLQASTTEVSVAAAWRIPDGADGGVVSGQADVDTVVVVSGE